MNIPIPSPSRGVYCDHLGIHSLSLDPSCFDIQLISVAHLTLEGIEKAERLLKLSTLTGAERGDLESALDQQEISPSRMKEIWQNHISELL